MSTAYQEVRSDAETNWLLLDYEACSILRRVSVYIMTYFA